MIRFATIGTNTITERFLDAAQESTELSYEAVYSRSEQKAKSFAKKYGVKKCCTNLEKLAQDRDIDGVYIASPNSLHFEQSMLMLSNKKHVLCEKTIASNQRELEIMLRMAKENNVILLEAMRSAFDPAFVVIKDNLKKLGKIKNITFSYCQYSSKYDNFKAGIIENSFNPDFSGGALMDIGVYCVHPMVKLFGEPKKITATSLILENGIDGEGKIIANYENFKAELIYSKIADSKDPSTIEGGNGIMLIDAIANPNNVQILFNNGEKETIFTKNEEWNLVHEIKEWARLINSQITLNMNNEYSMLSLAIMDEARKQTGLYFPADYKTSS